MEPPRRSRLTRLRTSLRRSVLRRRRLLAAVALAVAVVAGLRTVAPPPEPTRSVLVAAHDLPAGSTLAVDDLERREVPPGALPAGVLADPAGQVLAGPVRAGEPVTDVRVLGGGLLSAYPGTVGVPVRLPDPDAAAMLAAGDLIDLYAGAADGSGSRLLAPAVRVVALPPSRSDGGLGGALGGRLVLLAVPPAAVHDVTDAAVADYLTFTITA